MARREDQVIAAQVEPLDGRGEERQVALVPRGSRRQSLDERGVHRMRLDGLAHAPASVNQGVDRRVGEAAAERLEDLLAATHPGQPVLDQRGLHRALQPTGAGSLHRRHQVGKDRVGDKSPGPGQAQPAVLAAPAAPGPRGTPTRRSSAPAPSPAAAASRSHGTPSAAASRGRSTPPPLRARSRARAMAIRGRRSGDPGSPRPARTARDQAVRVGLVRPAPSAPVRVGRGAEAEVLAAHPVVLVVTALPARAGEVRDLVAATGRPRSCAPRAARTGRATSSSSGQDELARRHRRVHRRPRLQGEQVGREVAGAEFERRIESHAPRPACRDRAGRRSGRR